MALLLRMGGIPARVAVGFTTGTYDTATHQYVVSDIDAHAWVEAWFPHYGWVRFDPTPAAAPRSRRQRRRSLDRQRPRPGSRDARRTRGRHGLRPGRRRRGDRPPQAGGSSHGWS